MILVGTTVLRVRQCSKEFNLKISGMHLLVVIVLVLCPCAVVGHGSMVKPTNWMDFPVFIEMDDGKWVHDYAGMKSRKHCTPGNTCPTSQLFSLIKKRKFK